MSGILWEMWKKTSIFGYILNVDDGCFRGIFWYSVHLICAEYENINEGMSYHQYESVMCGFV